MPFILVSMPAPQVLHSELSEFGNWPTGHLSQLVLSSSILTRPLAHSSHACELRFRNIPGAQERMVGAMLGDGVVGAMVGAMVGDRLGGKLGGGVGQSWWWCVGVAIHHHGWDLEC